MKKRQLGSIKNKQHLAKKKESIKGVCFSILLHRKNLKNTYFKIVYMLKEVGAIKRNQSI